MARPGLLSVSLNLRYAWREDRTDRRREGDLMETMTMTTRRNGTGLAGSRRRAHLSIAAVANGAIAAGSNAVALVAAPSADFGYPVVVGAKTAHCSAPEGTTG